jgi:hypothetical protein
MGRIDESKVNSYRSRDLGLLMNFMGRPAWTATDIKTIKRAINAIDDDPGDLHPADLALVHQAGYPDLDSAVEAAQSMAAEWARIDRRPATITFVADRPRELAGASA